MCWSADDGTRHCRDRAHLEGLALDQLAPDRQNDRPDVAWRADSSNAPFDLYRALHEAIASEAVALILEARGDEADTTTALLTIAGRREDTRLDSLDWRMKAPASLARKLATKATVQARSSSQLSEIGARLEDIIRYTLVIGQHDDLVAGAAHAIAAVEQRGMRVTAIESSYFPGNPYKGLHVLTETVEGRRFELQIHSESSIRMKSRAHSLYEITRDATVARAERADAHRRLLELYEELETPRGLGSELAAHPVLPKHYPARRSS